MSYIVTRKARKDMDDLWFHIAKDKVTAANKVENDLLEAFDLIVETPYIGTRRNDLIDAQVRFWVVHNHYVIYDPSAKPLQILRIISCFQDIKSCY